MSMPIRLWSLQVPATGEIVALEELGIPLSVNVTMAAIDPTESVKGDGLKLSTLRIIHQTMSEPNFEDFDDDDDEDEDEDSSEEEEFEESEKEVEVPKGKAGKGANAKKGDKKATKSEKVVDADDDESEDDEARELLDSIMNGADSDDDDDISEAVLCTLDPLKAYQQPLNIHIGDGENVYFKATGAYTIYLTGNYIAEHQHEDDSDDELDEEDDYSDDYMDLINGEGDSEDESDELDDVEDPRITEIASDDEAPALTVAISAAELPDAAKISKKEKKAAAKAAHLAAKAVETVVASKTSKDAKKRSADEMDIDVATSSQTLADGSSVTTASATATIEVPAAPLSKKQLKKLKNNAGDAVSTATTTPSAEKKKVQFASQLETGPTPNGNKSPAAAEKTEAKPDNKPAAKQRIVDGVKMEDHKIGQGPEAKKGSKVSMRYIGKLTNGKVFDSNKKGKPFSFTVGSGEVIKGWDIGIAGMKVGGERKLTIPPNLAYGNKNMGDIPKNSTLVFEVKLIEIK